MDRFEVFDVEGNIVEIFDSFIYDFAAGAGEDVAVFTAVDPIE